MPELAFLQVDVFAGGSLSGNPLAVKDVVDLLGEKGVPPERIVREFYYAY